MSLFKKISNFFKKSEDIVEKSENPEVVAIEAIVPQMYLHENDNRMDENGRNMLLNDLTVGENREKLDKMTISEYRKTSQSKKKAFSDASNAVVERVYTANEIFMKERYGIQLNRRTNRMLPGFMSANFGGFFVGKSVETNKMYVFAGNKDIFDRKVKIGGGRPISYNMLNQWVGRDGKPMKGYVWYRVRDNEVLREMLERGEFEDSASRVWLEDYFAYVEFIAEYRRENPGVELNLSAALASVISK